MANAWGVSTKGPATNWADDVDQAEENGVLTEAFPTLGQAAKAPAPSKKEKPKKPVKMSLSQLMATDADLKAQLPTGSRGKGAGDDERDSGALGGGFGGYGGERRGEHTARRALLVTLLLTLSGRQGRAWPRIKCRHASPCGAAARDRRALHCAPARSQAAASVARATMAAPRRSRPAPTWRTTGAPAASSSPARAVSACPAHARLMGAAG